LQPQAFTGSQTHTFHLTAMDVNGPLNLQETIISAQTSEPEWLRNNDIFTDVEEIDGHPVKYSLTQTGTVDQFQVKVQVVSDQLNRKAIQQLRAHLNRVLGLEDDLPAFYRTFASQDAPLSGTFRELEGLRLMRGTDLYESLICSILSQNNSARLWNRTARLLMKYYGKRVDFADGTSHFLFPGPEVLARVAPRKLRARTSMGYRARPVVQVSGMITEGALRLEDFLDRSYENAMQRLLELPGVGPKVADCFLLYGAGKLEAAPVDVWIHRIVTKLYFRGRKVSKLKTARFLRERYGLWAGYAQLYLFDYARRGLMDANRLRKITKR